jgi:DNA polymerase I-like protein with 3'-5' exonuclease and polymerase domains
VHAKYGAEARGLWVARPNRVLVGIDASGLEGRVFIHYLGSKEAEEFMLNDPHTANANAITEVVGFLVSRQQAKTLFYARLYGASDFKLGSTLGYDAGVGEKIRFAIDSNIPGFMELAEGIEAEWKKNNTFIETIDGGFVRCVSPHAALNYKFQSCGAIIMKQAAIIHRNMLDEQNLDAIKVGDIHDEWQIDCLPEHADLVGKSGCLAINRAGHELKLNIELDGDYSVGTNWAETH